MHGHPLAHDALQAQQADAELVLQQLADRTDAAIAEVVDVVLGHDAGRDFDQAPNHGHHVAARQTSRTDRRHLEPGIGVFVDHDVRTLHPGVDVGILDAVMELAVELVAADSREIVALLVEEERLQKLLGVLGILGLAGTQLLVDLLERVLAGLDVFVFFDRVANQRAVVEKAQNRLVGLPIEPEIGARERADEGRDVDLAILVDANADRTLGLVVLRTVVGLELDPGTTVGDDRRVIGRARVRVDVLAVIDARRTHELAHDHALGAVDHEGALVGHERKIAHEDLLVGDALDFARLGGNQTNAHAQRRAVGHVALAALLDRILGLAQRMLAELQN